MPHLLFSNFFFCIHDIYKAPVAFFWYSLMPLMILELPKIIHRKLQIFPFGAIFQILLYKSCKKMISTRKNLQFWMNIFWEFWNDLWYQGVPEKCHRNFVDAISPDKIWFFKIGIVGGVPSSLLIVKILLFQHLLEYSHHHDQDHWLCHSSWSLLRYQFHLLHQL